MTRWMVGVVIVCALGCDDEPGMVDGGADASVEPSAPVAHFEVPETGPVEFADAPYPNEVFRGADGTLDLGSAPTGGPLWNAVRETVNERTGFCRTCPIHFPIDGSLDPASVPADGTDEGSASDPIMLMRADGTGGFLPLMIDAPSGSVRILPAGGRILEPNTAYLAAITDALTGPGGRPLQPTDTFLAIREGSDTTSRAAAGVIASLDALAAAGVRRDGIVSVAAFTTVDTGAILRNLASIVEAAAVPAATVDRVYRRSDGTLDDLLGTPGMPGNGLVESTIAGETAVNHENVEMIILGTFEVPRLVTGSGTDTGFLQRDADSTIEAISIDTVPYMLSIPVGADLSNLPVSVVAPGNTQTRAFGAAMANSLGALGIATISIDMFQNGDRAASALDAENIFRGTMVPDGFSEHSVMDVLLSQQGAARFGDEVALHTKFQEAVSTQWVSDLAMTIRLLQEGDVSAVAAADPALAGLAFDPSTILFVGLSAGASAGVVAVTLRAGVAAAVFNVAIVGGFSQTCHAPRFRPQVEPLLRTVFRVSEEFDGVDVRLCLHPAVALPFSVYEEMSAGQAVHYLLDEPLTDAPPPQVLFQLAELDEEAGQEPTEALVLAAGVPSGGDGVYSHTAITIESGPFSDNRTTPNGNVTAAAWMFGGASHRMLFSRTDTQGFETPHRFPFTPLDPVIPIDNPTDDVHAQIADFFRTVLAGGPVAIAAPP